MWVVVAECALLVSLSRVSSHLFPFPYPPPPPKCNVSCPSPTYHINPRGREQIFCSQQAFNRLPLVRRGHPNVERTQTDKNGQCAMRLADERSVVAAEREEHGVRCGPGERRGTYPDEQTGENRQRPTTQKQRKEKKGFFGDALR